MNFKNMSIKKSLIVGFGTTIMISVIIIVASLVMMNVQKGAYTDIIDHYVETNTLIADCRIDYNIAARNLRDVALSGDMNKLTTVTSKLDELSTGMKDMQEPRAFWSFIACAMSQIKHNLSFSFFCIYPR